MYTSRLHRSNNAKLRDPAAIKQYCDKHGIAYSENFDCIFPDDQHKQFFNGTYTLDPLPPTNLKELGLSTVLVFETKEDGNYHGDVVSAVAQQTGGSLSLAVNTIHIHSSLNPYYRKAFGRDTAEAISKLVENQGIPVLHTSIGWNDQLLNFDKGHEDQADHLWRVTAFVVDSTGNEGKFELPKPIQKHNSLTHFAPLVVHVGAAALNTDGKWCIEGYSAANGPTVLAPVASRTFVQWGKDKAPANLTGTSASAPYVSGMLAALNHRYGAYLTREQILYAVIATATPITHVNAYEDKTPEALDIEYKKNAAGLAFNPEYGGFGLVHIKKADKLLSQMVALTQEHPEAITVPTEERITLNVSGDDKRGADKLYHYEVELPKGYALKTTFEADFVKKHGDISITSPAGTNWPMVMSTLDSKEHHFGISTSHGWAGESTEGKWIINSTEPIKRLRLSQHHFLERDIIHLLNIPQLLDAPTPDLSHARTLQRLTHEPTKRVLHTQVLPESEAPLGLKIGEERAEADLSSFESIVTQLKALPSGFEQRHERSSFPALMIDPKTPAGQLEVHCAALYKQLHSAGANADDVRQQLIATQLAAAEEYRKEKKPLHQIVPLTNAGLNYLWFSSPFDSEGNLNAEKAVPLLSKALRIAKRINQDFKASDLDCHLYTALCRCCENGKSEKYARMLKGVRKDAVLHARKMQGEIDPKAYRIETGEYCLSDDDKIGTDNIGQSIVVIAQNPHTRKTGIAHIDNATDVETLGDFFGKFSDDRLQIRLVGARADKDYKTDENLTSIMQYLARHVNCDIISADIYQGNKGPSTVVVDPHTFSLEEKVPTRTSSNEAASNAITLYLTHKGKPLVEQFNFTQKRGRNPIHLNHRMLTQFREHCFGKNEWEVERYLRSQEVFDRPLMVHHIQNLERAYNEQWTALNQCMDEAIERHHIGPADAARAREALARQSLYVGEHAEAANAPIMEWIRHQLFDEEHLKTTQIKGPMADVNVYDPVTPSVPAGNLAHAIRPGSEQSFHSY